MKYDYLYDLCIFAEVFSGSIIIVCLYHYNHRWSFAHLLLAECAALSYKIFTIIVIISLVQTTVHLRVQLQLLSFYYATCPDCPRPVERGKGGVFPGPVTFGGPAIEQKY